MLRAAHQAINQHPARQMSYLGGTPLTKSPEMMPTAPTQVGGAGDVSDAAYAKLSTPDPAKEKMGKVVHLKPKPDQPA